MSYRTFSLHPSWRLALSVCFSLLFAVLTAWVWPTPAVWAQTGAVLTVNQLGDTTDGNCTPDHCTLREAITLANDTAGDDTIVFNMSASSIITLSGQLPSIHGVLTVDGGAVNGLTISGNDAVRHFYVPPGATLTVRNLTISNGKAYDPAPDRQAGDLGGAINNDGTLSVEHVRFYNNRSVEGAGGAIYSTGAAQVNNSQFSRNRATWGGAIESSSPTAILTVTTSTFSVNSVTNRGAGIWNGRGGGGVYISSSTFTHNYGGDHTGYGATLSTNQTIVNSTFADNGIFNQGTLTVKNSTVANSSSYGLHNAAGSSTLYNTILAANTAGNCAGSVVNGGNNIDSGTTCGFGATNGSMSNTDPKLAYVSYSGGAIWILALRQNSPALNTGNDAICAETATVNNRDQRGVTRPQGAHCDIGAFELAEVVCPTPNMQNISGFVDGCFRSGLIDVYRYLEIEAVAQQPDGKIIIGGRIYPGDGYRYVYLARLNPDGTQDSTFNLGVRPRGWVSTIAIQPDGKILLNGVTRNDIARLNMDGTLDSSFTANLSDSTIVHTIVVQADGKILIGTSSGVVRLNPNGTLDGGFSTSRGTSSYAPVNGITVADDGKIFIAGYFSTVNGIPRNNIAKLNADGSLDTSFDPGVGPNNEVYEIAIQADGKVLIGGKFTQVDGITRNHMARLAPNGPLDVSFDPAIEVIQGDDEDTFVDSFEIQEDNKIVVVRLQEYTDAAHLLRLNDDGSLDPLFRPRMPFDDEVRDLLLQSNGNLWAVGDFTHVDGYAREQVVRLLNPPPAKEIKTVPTTLQFPAELQDSNDPAPLTIAIDNARTTGVFAWSVETDATWLQASPAFGNTPATTQVQARVGGLPVGLHTANLIVTSRDPAVSNTPYTVPVSINIAPRGGGLPFLRVSPASLNFLTDPIAGNPAARTFTIDNLGGSSLTWQATVNSAAQSWLSLDRSSGVAPATVNVAVNINSLAPGNYVGEITVSENSGNSPAYTLYVLLTLQPGPTLSLNTTKLVFTGRKNQENPAPQPLTINNSGAGAFTWQATENVDWLTLDLNSGAAPATIQANANTAGLNVGVYRGQMSVSSATAANSPTNVDTILGVLTGAILDVKSPLVTFDTILGKNPSDGQLVVRNAGAGNLEWVASEEIPWLSLSQTSGAIQGHNNSTTLQLTVNSALLAIGTYRGQITFTSPNGDASPQTINIILTVASPVKYCNLTDNRVNLLEGSRVKLYLENVTITHNDSGCHFSGVLRLNLPQNANLTANLEGNARLDNGTSTFTAEAGAEIILEIANMKLKLGKKNVVMRELVGLTLETSGWDLPPLFGGGSQPFAGQITISLNGVTINGQQAFDLPNLQWDNFSITQNKGTVSFSSDGNYQIAMSGMIAIVIPGSGNANSQVTLTLDNRGIRTGAINNFTITGFAGLDLTIDGAQVTSERISANSAKLKVPGAWGGLSVVIYALEIRSNGAVKIGGGEFSLPDIKAGGDAFQLSSLRGKLMALPGGGYEIQAMGMFGMSGLSNNRTCQIWVDVTVRTGPGNTSILAIQSPDGVQNVMSANPLPTATDGVQDNTTADGLSLRQFTLGVRCRPGWPIAATGFFLTGVEGKIQLSSHIESVSVKVWIESKAQVGNEPAISAVPQITIRPKPFAIDFNSPIYIVGKKTGNTKVNLTQRAFSTEITFDYSVLRGGYGLAAGVNNANNFFLRGSGWAEIYVEKGAILNECISYPAPTWKDPGRWLESCISVPDSSQHLARADAAIDLNGIEVKTSIAGYRARAYYSFRSGKISVGQGLVASMVTSAQINAARQRWEATQRGEIVTAAFDEGLSFTPDGAILVTMAVEPPLATVQASDVITSYPVFAQADVIFGLVQAPTGTLQLNLITPTGQEITPNSLPNNVRYYQTVSVSETQSVYIVPQAAIGNWQTKVVGNTANQYYFVLHALNTPPSTLQNLKLAATSNPTVAEVSWQLLAAEEGTAINLYAQTAPLTATIPYTDADGNVVTDISPLFAGTLLRTIVNPNNSGAPQIQQLDLSTLPTGQYSFWIEATGANGGTVRCFIRRDTTDCDRTGVNTVVINVDHTASFPAQWTTVITNEVNVKTSEMLVQWLPNSHPDVDNYIVRVRTTDLLTPTEEVITDYVIGPADNASGSAIVSNIAPGHTYYISIGAQALASGRIVWSQEQMIITPQPEFLLSTDATNIQLVAGGNGVTIPLLVDMASDLPFAVALDLDYQRLPDGIYATFDAGVIAASTTLAQSSISITASGTLLPGQYVVPIMARSGLLEHSLNLIVTVTPADSAPTNQRVYLPLINQ